MLRKKLVVLAVAGLIALLGIGVVADRTTQFMIRSERRVEHSYQVLNTIERLRTSIAEAETSTRGYVITSRPSFKDDFTLSTHALRRSIESLRMSTADNPSQTAVIDELAPTLAERLDLLGSVMAMKERKAADPNIQMTVLSGTLLTKAINARLSEIRTEEMRLLGDRQQKTSMARRLAVWGPWSALLVALVMFGSLSAQVWLTLASERRARRDLEKAVADEQLARKRAEDTDRLKDEFLATLSHELRTPLTSMVGWASLLEDPQHAPELLHQGIRSISEAARVQTRLIEDLLDISRIVSGKLHIALGLVDLPGVIRDAIASVSPAAQVKHIALRTVLDETIEGIIGDPARLQQVVWNLLTNAVKFTPKNGHIDVLLRRADSHVEISVIDDGDGIEASFLPHVFDRFRQADSSATRPSGGLGIGLSIAKSLVEAHGGAVRVESAGPGKGSAFHVELPILRTRDARGATAVPSWHSSDVELQPAVASPSREPVGILERRSILLIDDDQRTLQIVTTMLERDGARVLKAANTSEAMEFLETDSPDLIICDIGMPGEDGLTYIRRLRSMLTAYAQMPAIALTAFARADDRVTALGAGFNAYLAKPVTREELVVACASLLRLVPERRSRSGAAQQLPAQ